MSGAVDARGQSPHSTPTAGRVSPSPDNLIEGGVAIVAGFAANSQALVGFGVLDIGIESVLVLWVWRVKRHEVLTTDEETLRRTAVGSPTSSVDAPGGWR